MAKKSLSMKNGAEYTQYDNGKSVLDFSDTDYDYMRLKEFLNLKYGLSNTAMLKIDSISFDFNKDLDDIKRFCDYIAGVGSDLAKIKGKFNRDFYRDIAMFVYDVDQFYSFLKK